jgi:hypothetical protein
MQFQPLPTPLQALRKLWETFVGVLLVIAIALVFSSVTQAVLAISGLLIAVYGHWIIGVVMMVIAGAAQSARRALRF